MTNRHEFDPTSARTMGSAPIVLAEGETFCAVEGCWAVARAGQARCDTHRSAPVATRRQGTRCRICDAHIPYPAHQTQGRGRSYCDAHRPLKVPQSARARARVHQARTAASMERAG